MNKIILPPILILMLISCKSYTESTDYLGQAYPNSIPVIFAPDIISKKGRLEHGISFTPNTRELAFGVLNKDDLSGEIFYSKKISEKWAEPMVFEPLKNECVYLPYFSPDGKSLLYAQSKPNTDNAYTDIWMIEKINDDWVSPKIIQAPLSSASRESNACMTNDGVGLPNLGQRKIQKKIINYPDSAKNFNSLLNRGLNSLGDLLPNEL